MYVSFICAAISARPHSSAREGTHEKKSNEDDEYPHCKDMVGPSPIKVLWSARISTWEINLSDGETQFTWLMNPETSGPITGPRNGAML